MDGIGSMNQFEDYNNLSKYVVYVNPRQYDRMLKRRMERDRLMEKRGKPKPVYVPIAVRDYPLKYMQNDNYLLSYDKKLNYVNPNVSNNYFNQTTNSNNNNNINIFINNPVSNDMNMFNVNNGTNNINFCQQNNFNMYNNGYINMFNTRMVNGRPKYYPLLPIYHFDQYPTKKVTRKNSKKGKSNSRNKGINYNLLDTYFEKTFNSKSEPPPVHSDMFSNYENYFANTQLYNSFSVPGSNSNAGQYNTNTNTSNTNFNINSNYNINNTNYFNSSNNHITGNNKSSINSSSINNSSNINGFINNNNYTNFNNNWSSNYNNFNNGSNYCYKFNNYNGFNNTYNNYNSFNNNLYITNNVTTYLKSNVGTKSNGSSNSSIDRDHCKYRDSTSVCSINSREEIKNNYLYLTYSPFSDSSIDSEVVTKTEHIYNINEHGMLLDGNEYYDSGTMFKNPLLYETNLFSLGSTIVDDTQDYNYIKASSILDNKATEDTNQPNADQLIEDISPKQTQKAGRSKKAKTEPKSTFKHTRNTKTTNGSSTTLRNTRKDNETNYQPTSRRTLRPKNQDDGPYLFKNLYECFTH